MSGLAGDTILSQDGTEMGMVQLTWTRGRADVGTGDLIYPATGVAAAAKAEVKP